MPSGVRSGSKSSYTDRTSESSESAVSANEGPPWVELFPEAVTVSSSLGAGAVLDWESLKGIRVRFCTLYLDNGTMCLLLFSTGVCVIEKKREKEEKREVR